MEHPFTWYNSLPDGLQHAFGDHTFFALIAGIADTVRPRSAWRFGQSQDPAVPAAELGSQKYR